MLGANCPRDRFPRNFCSLLLLLRETTFKLGEGFSFFPAHASSTSREITRCGVSVFATLCREPIHSSELKEIPVKKEKKEKKKRERKKRKTNDNKNNNIAVHGIEHGVLNLQ
jgi:hypothetical protein